MSLSLSQHFPHLNCMSVSHLITRLQTDPCVSNWLKDALESALDRDPVDAARDSLLLAYALDRLCEGIVNEKVTSARVIKGLIAAAKGGRKP